MDIFSNIDLNRFLSSLQYMWKGMLSIFIVISVIILAVVVMNLISKKAAERKELKDAEDQQGAQSETQE